jgi:signal transduction histidine kinase
MSEPAADERSADGVHGAEQAVAQDGATAEPPVTLQELRTVDLFEELDDEQLAKWIGVAHTYRVAAGGIIAEQGEENRGMQLLLRGDAQASIVDGSSSEPVGRHKAPTWMGAIATLTGGSLGVRMRAETDCRMALIPAEDFRRLAFEQPAIHRRVMQQVAPVMSRITSSEQSRERLTSLGTMAAGLAHELNNPAAAARRAAQQMSEALEVISSTIARFVESGMEREQVVELVTLQQQAVAHSASSTALDALDAADAEDELLVRLEALGVHEPWRLAEPLAVAGVDQAWLDRVAELAGEATDAALQWVAASLVAGRLAAELEESTERMSSLVGAVKSYAYMDRGDLVEVDLHEGLETTLAVLGYKLKHTEIEVVREYDRTLPKLTVHGSELNQVWTNLLDNAIDALGQSGTITIATHADGECAVIEISDDDAGVPEDVLPRIFDPFFTTKDVGYGTGLGLATARRIVVDRHDGSLTLDSQPGRTTFRVRLPFAQSGK